MRRTVLPALAAALLALPASAAAAPRAEDFVRAVDDGTPTARAAGGERVVTIRPGRRFDVVGLRWAGRREHVHGQLRVTDARGWKRWVPIPHAHSARGSDPVWANGAHAIQLRLERPVRGLKLHFVRVAGERPAPPRPVARAAAAQPAIVPRAQWGGETECKPRDTPSLGAVQMAFVHHTVNANDYAPADSAAMVLGICRFHRNSNGWDDVGYNFLVDKYGQIFEGRAGGVDQPVVGAQAQGWNAQSTGIANLGTYQDVPQTDQALDAMARLIAWKLPLHGTPVTGSVTLESAGGSSNRFAAGTSHTFERISGHRDGNETECPGAQLFAQLPRLRSLTDAKAPDVIPPAGQPVPSPTSKLTLAAARVAFSFPEPAQLSGRLTTADGRPIPNTPVRLQVLTARGFKAVAGATTGPDGGYSASLPTTRNRAVRALVGRVASNTVRLRVAPALQVVAPPARTWFKRRVVLRGTLRPSRATLVVEAALQRGTTYRRLSSTKVAVRGGRFRGAIPLARPGLYRLRVRWAGDARNAPAQADFFVRSVRRLSGAAEARAAR